MQAFLDRDGAVGSLMGFKGPTWVWGHGDSWLGHGDLKLGPCSDLGSFKKKFSSWHFILLHRHVHFVSDLYHLGVISAQEVCIR